MKSYSPLPVLPCFAPDCRGLQVSPRGVAISLQGSLLATCYYCYTTNGELLVLDLFLSRLFMRCSISYHSYYYSLSLIDIPSSLWHSSRAGCDSLYPPTSSLPFTDRTYQFHVLIAERPPPVSQVPGTRYHRLAHHVCYREQHPEPYGFWQFK